MISQNHPPNLPNPRGDGGGVPILPDYKQPHFRQRCRDVVEILQFRQPDGSSVLSEDEVKSLLRGAIPLASQAAEEGRARDYRAAMQVLYAAARLEQTDRPELHQHAHVHAEADVDDLIRTMELEAERRGLIDGGNGDGQA